MGFLAIIDEIMNIATAAQQFIPLLAIAHTTTTPDASNAALANTSKIITAAQQLVAVGESAAASATASGATAPTGIQKLAIAQAAVQQAHNIATANGATTATFDAVWTPLNLAITAVCAANKSPADPIPPNVG